MAARFRTFTPERRGHGHTPDVDDPITFEVMVQDTIRFLEEVVGGPARPFGCSDDAIVALLVALRRPDLVARLVFVAGVFHHDGWIPQAIDPDNEPPEFMADLYGEVSPNGRGHFRIVADKLARMHLSEPSLSSQDLAHIPCRTLVMVGDDDEVILHAIALYRALPEAELAVVPGTLHGLLVEEPELCNSRIIDFLTTEAVPTFARSNEGRNRLRAEQDRDGDYLGWVAYLPTQGSSYGGRRSADSPWVLQDSSHWWEGLTSRTDRSNGSLGYKRPMPLPRIFTRQA